MISRQQLATLSYEELRELLADVTEFIQEREEEEKVRLWTAAIVALQNYHERFGTITIRTPYDDDFEIIKPSNGGIGIIEELYRDE